MRNVILTTMLLGFSIAIISGTKKTVHKKAPPGTIWLRDNLFIDKEPIKNVHYREFEYAMSKIFNYNLDSVEQKVNTLPYYGFDLKTYMKTVNYGQGLDSTEVLIDRNQNSGWHDTITYSVYIDHPSYNYSPVVNVTYETAVLYSKLRTQMVLLLYAAERSASNRDKFYKKVKYRLPAKEEWEYALQKFAAKDKRVDFGYYNVSEMILEKSVAKGCNWKDKASKGNVNYTTSYTAPAAWLGFRCICEVEK